MSEALSLEDYAQANPGERKCWTCNLPGTELDQVNAGKGRIPVPKMVQWLQARGHDDATVAKINFHFSARHYVLAG